MSTNERRINARYPVRAFATLTTPEKGSSNAEWTVHLLDISAKGAKLAVLDEHQLKKGDSIELRLEVPQLNLPDVPKELIHLAGKIVHQQEHVLGVTYETKSAIDQENLKRLLVRIQ